jgi:hypothetical protein
MRLYHFSSKNNLTSLNPNEFGKNSYTRSDKKVSDVPRVFFYTDPTQKESFFKTPSVFLYSTEVDDELIYDLNEDKEDLKNKFFSKRRDIDALLKHFSSEECQYKGLKYKTSQFDVVLWFEEINVTNLSIP